MDSQGLLRRFAQVHKCLTDGLCLRTTLIGMALIAVPVLAALTIAERQSMQEQKAHAALLATEILRRSEALSAQIDAAFSSMKASDTAQPCSDDSIVRMVSAAANSGSLSAIGYVRDNRLLCSSFGRYGPGIAIGEPDFLSRLNYSIWTAVALPGIGDKRFLISVDKASGYASILHPEGAIDFQTDNQDTRVGLYGLMRRTPISQRGAFKPKWSAQLTQGESVQFFDGAFVVALKRSQRYDYAAFAAIPAVRLQEGWKNLALLLVPLGLLASFLFALLALQLSRYQKAMPAQLKLALRNHELFLVYQPIVELASGRWIGAEALIRWRRPNGEMVPPDVFIPIAESSELIERVTDRVIELFATDATALLQAHPDFYIGINLSAGDFQSPRISQKLHVLTQTLGIRPANVYVEVTERLLMNTEASHQNMQMLRDRGIRIAIDDFGTGYSSLSYLTSLPLDYLKIDKAFVDTIGKDAVTSQVVKHIIGIAQSLKLAMIAEGVEHQAQADYLTTQGVEFAQGWLFSRPMAISALKRFLDCSEKP